MRNHANFNKVIFSEKLSFNLNEEMYTAYVNKNAFKHSNELTEIPERMIAMFTKSFQKEQ